MSKVKEKQILFRLDEKTYALATEKTEELGLRMLRSTCYAAAASRNLPGTQRYLLKMA